MLLNLEPTENFFSCRESERLKVHLAYVAQAALTRTKLANTRFVQGYPGSIRDRQDPGKISVPANPEEITKLVCAST